MIHPNLWFLLAEASTITVLDSSKSGEGGGEEEIELMIWGNSKITREIESHCVRSPPKNSRRKDNGPE